jgi:nucleotide-binding universal stress UspA family protein
MFKSILVPIEGSEYSKAAMYFAIRIAKDHDAQLSGMAIIDKPDIEKSLGPVPLGGMYYALQAEEKKLTEAEAQARDLVDDFSKACKKEGVAFHPIVREGVPVELISDEAKYHDIAVMGLKTLFKYGAKEDDNALEEYLGHAAQPVIAVPKSYHNKNLLL